MPVVMGTFERDKRKPLFAFQVQGAEARMKMKKSLQTKPFFFIPKSSVTIPAYKADCKQGHLQAKQPFPCHKDY